MTVSTADLQSRITASWNNPDALDIEAVDEVLALLDAGKLRVCEPQGDNWVLNEWVKQAVLLYFRAHDMQSIESGYFEYRDKVPVKRNLEAQQVRVVPPAVARYGSFLEPGVVMMPSYVNIGAYVGSGTMVDTWATVGSCAQIGKNVHLAGGVGIGGVLEPVQASPVIIEDEAFIGSRCVVVEGARVGKRAVLGANTVVTASTYIIDVTSSESVDHRGVVPANAIVIPGTRTREFPAGSYNIPCALIIGWRNEKTDDKVAVNDLLRDHGIAA